MNNQSRYKDYYNPKRFYDISNIAYAEYQNAFDYGLLVFRESESIKDKIKKYYNNEQYTSMLIFADSQNLYIAILKLCNEGLADVAGILLRSLFEDYIQLKFIKKNKLGDRFNNYIWISLKRQYDHAEKYIPESEILDNNEYLERKKIIDVQYEKYKNDYTRKVRNWKNIKSWIKPQRVVQNKWSNKSLLKMARNVGEKEAYQTIMPYHSKFVHCDPSGLANFLQGDKHSLVINNSASLRGIDLILNITPEIFSRIAIEMALSFRIAVPDFFKKYIKR